VIDMRFALCAMVMLATFGCECHKQFTEGTCVRIKGTNTTGVVSWASCSEDITGYDVRIETATKYRFVHPAALEKIECPR
jgi:hypothetical protein